VVVYPARARATALAVNGANFTARQYAPTQPAL
jgi:hypothetical protein